MSEHASSASAAASASEASQAAPTASSESKAAASGGEPSMTTTIASMNDLKNKAPQVYKLMLISIAQQICIQMKHDQDNITAAMRKNRENS
jgi:hypothetical protein